MQPALSYKSTHMYANILTCTSLQLYYPAWVMKLYEYQLARTLSEQFYIKLYMLLNAPQRSITESQYYSLPVVYTSFFHGFVDSNNVDYTVTPKPCTSLYSKP